MADTLPRITIPDDVWVDLYAASGIPVGTQITVHNVGNDEVFLSTKATQPTEIGLPVKPYQSSTNEAGDSGAWAFAPNGTTVIVG